MIRKTYKTDNLCETFFMNKLVIVTFILTKFQYLYETIPLFNLYYYSYKVGNRT